MNTTDTPPQSPNEDNLVDEEPDDEATPTPDRRQISPLVVTIVVGLLTLAIGFGSGVWIAAPRTPCDDSAEAGFARDMSTHHAQAVAMSMLEYRNGGDGHIRTLAYDIATTQQAQIGIMDTWLRQWKLSPTDSEPPMTWMAHGDTLLPDGRMPGMASKEELQQLENSRNRDADVLFCKLMITHHLGGIHMAEAVLRQSDNAEVRRLAKQMLNHQQYEIDQMREKLIEWGETG